MPEVVNPWLSLAADDTLWPKPWKERGRREEIIQKLASGEIAFPVTGDEESPVFQLRQFADRKFLVPHRHQALIDFLWRQNPGAKGDTQEDALRILSEGKHLLLTGGPGTGKSFTLSNFVGALKPIAGRPPRVAIAAPTGKAAARFKHLESARHALVESSTIHRLLGLSRDERSFRFNAQNPLPCDVLIIDEISMLDLGLFSAAVCALPHHAQLVLAGDLDQLPAVDALPVDNAIRFLSAENVIAHVHLQQVQRFSAEKAHAYRAIATHGLSALGDAEVAAVVKHRRLPDAAALAAYADVYAREKLCSENALALRQSFKNLGAGENPPAELAAQGFAFLKAQVLLCERREGPLGSVQLNRRLAAAVARLMQTADRTLEPVMNTVNNYDLGLYNGDVGFILEYASERQAVFETPEGGFRVLPAVNIPGLETAYAMTIHKSQGSEYENAFVLCAGGANTDRRLLYTAVTRAKNEATILEILR